MGIRTLFDNMIAAREKHARLMVNSVLLAMDDETLQRAGYDRKKLMAEGSANFPF
jgi:hypothetical protein